MEEVVKFLKDNEKSTSEIASHLCKNYYDTIKILEDLESQGLITKIELGRYTYWKIGEKRNGKK